MSSSVRMAAYSTFCTDVRQGEMYSAESYPRQMNVAQRELVAPRLDDPHDRLMWAREHAGFKTATDAARRHHWNENTYRSHENGARGISKKAAAGYARAYKMPVEWLLYGQGSMEGWVDPELRSLWDNLSEPQRRRAIRVLRALVDEREEAA
jgi:hypothetical protein